jgi:hypothetical protein
MASDRNGESSEDTLNGWKEIAAFLGKSVRTAQRWERELGLPTHRIKTPDGQIIFSKRSEIDVWRSSTDQRRLGLPDSSPDHAGPSRGRKIAWAAAAFVVLVAGALGIWKLHARWRPAAPTTLRFVGREIQAVDPSGAVVWAHRFDSDVSPLLGATVSIARVDIDGDGQPDDLVPIRYGPYQEPISLKSDGLMALSSDGRVLWTATSNRTVACGGERYTGPWKIDAYLVSRDTAPARVFVAYSHHTWWPSFVMEILRDGTQVPRYFQAGWIESLAEWKTPSGTWGVAGGVMNEPARASVALFDLNGSEQVMPATDAKFSCSITGTRPPPQRVVLLPELEVTRAGGDAYAMVADLRVVGSDLRADTGANVVTTISADGTVTDLSAGDDYWMAHRKLEASHKLTHSVASCPELTTPKEVRSWTPAGGWRSSTIAMTSRQSSPRR